MISTDTTLSALIGAAVGGVLSNYSRMTPLAGAAIGAAVGGATAHFVEQQKLRREEEETAALNGNGGGLNGNGGGVIGPPQCGEGFVHDGGIPGTCIPVSEAAALGLPTGDTSTGDATPSVIINPAFANVSVQPIDPSLIALRFNQ